MPRSRPGCPCPRPRSRATCRGCSTSWAAPTAPRPACWRTTRASPPAPRPGVTCSFPADRPADKERTSRMPSVPAGSRYVAMGSSFGAGPGLTPRAPGSPRRAGRSAGNYAHLVAGALGLDLRDVTYSGATTSALLQSSAAGQPAQLDAVTPDTRLVTITAGGNDVGYLPRLTFSR